MTRMKQQIQMGMELAIMQTQMMMEMAHPILLMISLLMTLKILTQIMMELAIILIQI